MKPRDQTNFEWRNSGFQNVKLLLKLIAEKRHVSDGKVSFSGSNYQYWLPVLNTAVVAHDRVGALKPRCVEAAISDPSVSLEDDPSKFLEACNAAFNRLQQRPNTEFIVYSSLTYDGPPLFDAIEDGDVKIEWLPAKADNNFLHKANDARKELSHIMSGRKVVRDVSSLSTLLAYVPARDAREAFERAIDSVDRLRGMLNLLINSSRGLHAFHDLMAPHAMNKFRRGQYQTVHNPDGSLAAEMFWYEPGWYHDAEGVTFSDPSNYRDALQKFWERYQLNPLRALLSDCFTRYCRALDSHEFETSLIRLWSVLEELTGSENGLVVVDRIRKLFKDDLEAAMVAEHIRIRRNSNVHQAITPGSREQDAILVQLNTLVSQILFFCLKEGGSKIQNVQELIAFLGFSIDEAWLTRQQALMEFFSSYRNR
ncbi:hypothetical protein AB7M59_006521 [Bradyrhizobium elkanii]